MLVLGVLAGPPEDEVYDGLVETLPRVAGSQRALTVSLVQLSCWQYQPRGVFGALPGRAARRRSGSLMVAGVEGGLPWVSGGLAGRAIEV